MSKLPSEILADIAAAIEPATAPVELIAKLNAFIRAESAALQRLRMGLLLLAVGYAEDFEDQGYDREQIDRAIAGELVMLGAWIIAAHYRRRNEQFSPGRFALVAYDLAAQASDAVGASADGGEG